MISREESSYFDRICFYSLYDFFCDLCCYKGLLWNYDFSFFIFDVFEGDTIREFSLSHFHKVIDDTKWSRDKSIFIDTSIR